MIVAWSINRERFSSFSLPLHQQCNDFWGSILCFSVWKLEVMQSYFSQVFFLIKHIGLIEIWKDIQTHFLQRPKSKVLLPPSQLPFPVINVSKNYGVFIISKKHSEYNEPSFKLCRLIPGNVSTMGIFCKQSKDCHSSYNHGCNYYLAILQQSNFCNETKRLSISRFQSLC